VRAVALTGLAVAALVVAIGDPGSLSGARIVAGLLMAGGLVVVRHSQPPRQLSPPAAARAALSRGV
jgi:hypothetical protein